MRRQGLVALVLGAAALAGCGQKGPLFLPVPPKVPDSSQLRPSIPETGPAVIAPAAPASATP